MEMMEAIANRVSRRNYTGEPIAKDVLERIGAFGQECNRLSGLHAALLEDGSAGFRSVKKTYGMFSNVRTVILLKGQADMPHFYFQDGRVTADVTNDYKYDLTDLGIAKFHFSVGAGGQGHFNFGNGAGYTRL